MFSLHAWPLGDERWRDHVTGVAPLLKRSVEHVAGAARFVTRVDLTALRNPVEPFLQLGKIVRQPIQPRRCLAPSGRTAMVMDSLCTSIPR